MIILTCVVFSKLLIICVFISFMFIPGMYSQAFSFCEKVKEKLSSSDDYQTFLKCLHIFSNGIIKRNDLQNLVCACFCESHT